MKKGIATLFGIMISLTTMAQTDSITLPYYQIPEYPAEFNANTVVARMVDGLGFRYFWATEGLRAEDLAFRPNKEARTAEETLDHILGLTDIILNSVKKVPNTRIENSPKLSFEEKRKRTLENIKLTSDILKSSMEGEMTEFKLIFEGRKSTVEYPFWNNINGPIADAIWHVGQVVSFRRSSGNPFNSKASVFNGKIRK